MRRTVRGVCDQRGDGALALEERMSNLSTHKSVRRKKSQASRAPVRGGAVETPDEPPAELPEEQQGAFIEGDRRHARIAERAYQLAEQRAFEPGHDVDDWLAAEGEVEREGSSPDAESPDLCGD